MAFDAPGREECTATRVASNNPLQALVLLNDPTYVEAARVLAERTLRSCTGDATARTRWIFAQALNREPTADELRLLVQLFDKQQSHYRQSVKSAEELMGTGLSASPKDLDAPELAAWTAVCRTVLNLHETITRF